MDQIAHQVRTAMAAQDPSAFVELLDPDVTWGAPGDPNPACQNRNQVLAWYQRGREAGVQSSMFDVEVIGDRLLVSVTVAGTDAAKARGGAALRYQALTIRNGRIVAIVGFDDKTDALEHVAQSASS